MKSIRVTFKNGSATIATKGFAGKACLAATAGLEHELGVKTADTKTREYNETEATQEHKRVAGR